MRCLGVLVVTFAAILIVASAEAATEPRVVVWEGRHMAATKVSLDEPSGEVKHALRNVRNAAEEALRRGPYSVTHKNELPPSGNKHDYLSYSRYWWPNPDTEDGLPYIRRDGETNTRIRARGDRDRIGQLYLDVEALSLAYYFFEEEKYAEHASDLIQTWFLRADSRMNPHLKYAQAVPGRSEGRGVGIIDTRGFILLLDCVALLQDSPSFSAEDLTQLKEWFNEFLNWLQTSKLGQDERRAKNNHGSWYAAQASRIALFVENEELARQLVRNTAENRIPDQFRPDGSQPYENERTKSLHYNMFNLSALSVVARVGENLGVDLWDSTGTKGDNLQRGLAHVLPYLTNQSAWTHRQLNRYELSPKIIQLLRLASVRYEEPRFAEVVNQVAHRHERNNYAALVSAAHPGQTPRVDVLEGTPQPLKAYDLPDISRFTIGNVAEGIPTERTGRVTVDRSENYRLLDESFRRKRGDDLRERQGVEKTRTIVITQGPASLRQVVRDLEDPKIASINDGVVLLRLPLLIQPGAALVVDGSEVKELRLSTDRGSFIANAGALYVLNSKVTSWDENQEQPSFFSESKEFRPFISSYVRSKTYFAGSRFQHLGFSAPTAYGLSLSSHPEREKGAVREDWPTGQLVGNEFVGLYYGFYSYEARDVAIVGNTYDDSIRYGIDPHDRSTRLIIAKNIAKRTRERHGIIASRGVSHSYVFKNKSFDNNQSGLMLDRRCSNNLLAENQVFGNGQGIAIYESDDNLVAKNLVIKNSKSGVRVRNSVGVNIQENIVTGNADYGFEIYSKRLKDHDKREAVGDFYDIGVSAILASNFVTRNKLGCLKGRHVNRLVMSGFSSQWQESFDNALLTIPQEFNPSNDQNFGNALKAHTEELRKVFDHETVVVYQCCD